MQHNSDFTRLPGEDGEKARYFAEKYAPALEMLQRAEENDK
jgi:hypothetical protein